jgi:hypothetical protein
MWKAETLEASRGDAWLVLDVHRALSYAPQKHTEKSKSHKALQNETRQEMEAVLHTARCIKVLVVLDLVFFKAQTRFWWSPGQKLCRSKKSYLQTVYEIWADTSFWVSVGCGAQGSKASLCLSLDAHIHPLPNQRINFWSLFLRFRLRLRRYGYGAFRLHLKAFIAFRLQASGFRDGLILHTCELKY